MNRVVVTGIGVVSPLGSDLGAFFAGLIQGRSGIRQLELPWSRAEYAGTVDIDLDQHFPKIKRIGLDRVSMLALLAARQASEHSGLGSEASLGNSTGLYWGTGMGGAGTLEATYQDLYVKRAPRVKPSTSSSDSSR